MRPFEEQLSAGFDQLARRFSNRNFRAIEFVSAAIGFVRKFREITGNGFDRRGCELEPAELRMTSVAAGLTEQNFLSEQPFAPGGEQTFGVEILWINRPEPHYRFINILPATETANFRVASRPRGSTSVRRH